MGRQTYLGIGHLPYNQVQRSGPYLPNMNRSLCLLRAIRLACEIAKRLQIASIAGCGEHS